MRRALQFDIRVRVRPTADRESTLLLLGYSRPKLACMHSKLMRSSLLSGASDKVFLSFILQKSVPLTAPSSDLATFALFPKRQLLFWPKSGTARCHALCKRSFETLLSAFVQKMAQLFDRPSDSLRRAECVENARVRSPNLFHDFFDIFVRQRGETGSVRLGRNREERAESAVHQF